MDRSILRNLYFLSYSLANEGNQKYMPNQSVVELKNYMTIYAILGLETLFFYIRTVTLYWYS